MPVSDYNKRTSTCHLILNLDESFMKDLRYLKVGGSRKL